MNKKKLKSLNGTTTPLAIRRWGVRKEMFVITDSDNMSLLSKEIKGLLFLGLSEDGNDIKIIELSKPEATQLRDFLNEFIEEQNE